MTAAVPQIRDASWRWLVAATAALAVLVALTAQQPAPVAAPATASSPVGALTPPVAKLAATAPDRVVDVIVQVRAGGDAAAVRSAAARGGANLGRDLPLINGFGARMTAAAAAALAGDPAVRAISLNARVAKTGLIDPSRLATAYNQSIRADRAWAAGYTGRGVGIAVIDTGIQGGVTDFRGDDGASRVVASAVVNPTASDAGDTFGHGSHVAGLAAGNGTQRASTDPLDNRYVGVAPDANLIAVKADDGHGAATVLDVIDALQFVVDHKAAYNIRVVNLSLSSTVAESYKTDPLDAAVEAAWFNGIAVVVAAGNRGAASDAVSYSPGNDPFVISVGGVDDRGTKDISDDLLAAWSSRGRTQDGLEKPDVLAPGAHMVSVLSPGSEYASLCPQCVTDGEYFKVGGTSMAAAVVSGAVATILQAHPNWTPDQVKYALARRTRPVVGQESATAVLVDASGSPETQATSVESTVIGAEIALDKVLQFYATTAPPRANEGIAPNSLIDPATGNIDYTRASWSRASWSEAADPLRASWSRASWSRASWSRASWSATPSSCTDFERASWSRASWSAEEIDQAKAQCAGLEAAGTWDRASWSRASWSRASWSTSFDK